MIENGANGNWMIIPCNPHLEPPPLDQCYGTTTFGLGNYSNTQQIPLKNIPTFELFPPPPPSAPSSSQSHSKCDYRLHNESNFSLFSSNHTKLIEVMKNLELGSVS